LRALLHAAADEQGILLIPASIPQSIDEKFTKIN
jgi:hypothetical protein